MPTLTGPNLSENKNRVHEPSQEAIKKVAEIILKGKQVKNVKAPIVQKAVCQLIRKGEVSATIEHPKGTTEINLQAKNYNSYLAQVESGKWKIVGYKVLETQSTENRNLPSVEKPQFTPESLAKVVISDLQGLLDTGKPLLMSNYVEVYKNSGADLGQFNWETFKNITDFLVAGGMPPLKIQIKNKQGGNVVLSTAQYSEIVAKSRGLQIGGWKESFMDGTNQITGFGIDPEYIQNRNKSQQQPIPQLPQPNPQPTTPTQPTQNPQIPTSPNLPVPESPKAEKEKSYQHLGSWMTGVRIVKDDKTGEEVSAGFTGQYIQNTVGEIPEDIQNTIRNRLFAVAEGGAKDGLNTVVGRIINGKTVFAAINRIRDDRGRSASGYRYQMGQGGTMSDILPKIQICSLENNGTGGQFPFAGQNPNFELESLPNWSEIKSLIDNSQPNRPLILDSDKQYPITVVIKIAEKLAQKYKVEPSFAYQVTILEKPAEFLVITPTDKKSETLIKKSVVDTKPIDHQNKFDSSVNLESTIKGLFFGEPKAETLQNLTEIITEIDQNPKKYEDWEAKLERQGLNHTIKQQFISLHYPKMVLLQLLTAPSIDFAQTKIYQDYFEALNKQIKSGWFKKEDSEGKKEFLRFLQIYKSHFTSNQKIQTRIIEIEKLIPAS